MRGVLTGGRAAVVTRGATIGDAGVIKHIGHPTQRGVAGAAVGRGRNMRARFAGRGRAVVTTGASPLYLKVIDAGHRLPRRGRVAGFA